MDSNRTNDETIPGFTNVEDFTKDGFKVLMEAIRNANALPANKDYTFQNSQATFKKIINQENTRILSLMDDIIKTNGLKSSIKSSILERQTDLLLEVNDTILERVNDNIDVMNGVTKTGTLEIQAATSTKTVNGSWNKLDNNKDRSVASDPNLKLLAPKNLSKPQLFFADQIDNSNAVPWEPRIKEKPNSSKPLAIFLEETDRGEEFSHPYEFELDNLNIPNEQLLPEKYITSPKPLANTAFIEVDTQEKLNRLVEDLRNYKAISVDLEHHSYRSFMGITCLMQISTGDTDYIIDTLKLRDKLWVLNEIFTKPSILKVFHGADSDILWLQRDLSLYVVNMFDTYQAAKVLGYSSLSLAYLLERFCNFKPNKHFQLADWRVRPLPDVLKNYAREDTHFLIYIYHKLKESLLMKSGDDRLLTVVLNRSNDVCKRRYFKPLWTETSHLDFYRNCKRIFDNRQMCALKDLYQWRDRIAREEDESLGYVLPNHMLLQIAELLPREMQGILACCNPVPPLVKINLTEIHNIILKARDRPLEQPILQEDTRARGSTTQITKLNINSNLHCPHDLTKSEEFRDDLPTLLNGDESKDMESLIEKTETKFLIFAKETKDVKEASSQKQRYLAPFERYQLVKPFIQHEEKERTNTESKPDVIEVVDDIEQVTSNLENLVKDGTPQDDRLQSIHNYFSLLSKKTQEDVDIAKQREEQLYQQATKMVNEQALSLIQMGGTKKRKREEDVDEVTPKREKRERNSLDPKPHVKTEKSDVIVIQDTPTPKGKRARKRKARQQPKTDKQLGSNQKREKHQNFQPFDYSSVDFRQFEGGAGSANQGKTIKTTYKNKSKRKNINKSFAQSGIFNNNAKKKR